MFAQVQAIPFLSNQFKLKKYLGLSDLEIKENEALWRQENNVDSYSAVDTSTDIPGLTNVGIRPDAPEAVDPEVEPDLADIDPGDPTQAENPGLDSLAGGEPQL